MGLTNNERVVDPRKLSPTLLNHLSYLSNEQFVRIELLVNDTDAFTRSYNHQNPDATLFVQISKNHFLCNLYLSKAQVLDLVKQDFVIALELVRVPLVELKQEGLDLTLNEVTLLHHEHPSLAGTNMVLSIKENLFDTMDIDFKNRIVRTDLASGQIKIHATNMASIAAGGGNSSPMAKGVAWDASISSSDFKNLFPDPDAHFVQHEISVQNHAYGTGIENYYGIESVAYDALTNRLPYLMHVFSSGNAGDQYPANGNYAGLAWANLTGQFKQSKNTITAGATDSLNYILDLSSHGPAYDGRIKPEVVAYGHGGSSGAAAIVSGISLLIQEIYLKSFGELPPSSLVKATLINSARDIGAAGPDYKGGYGSVRAQEAVQTIEENHFMMNSVEQDGSGIFPIEFPPDLKTAKFTLVWNDPAAEPLSLKSLVNDIDMELEEVATGTKFYPWVLSAIPVEDSLMQTARKGLDTLNNIEQVTLESPSPGDYNIHIRGRSMKTSYQEFSLVWQFEKEKEFRWEFPTKDDHLNPAGKNTIRWKSTDVEPGIVEYRMIGENWAPIGSNVNPSSGYLMWNTPDNDGLAQLRWFNGDTMVVSDTFVISGPVEPKVVFVCPDSVMFRWQNPGSPDSFQILRLGLRHMEHYGYTKDTFYVEDNPDVNDPFYAVAAVYDNIVGPRSYSFDFNNQGAGCYLNVFYLRHVMDGKAFFAAELGLIEGIDSIVLQEKINGTFVTIKSLDQIGSTTLFFESGLLKQGINNYRLKIVLQNGVEIISQEEKVYYAGESDVLLFPNPASSDEEILLLTKTIEDFELRIFDLQGRLIYQANELSSPINLPGMRLQPGTYIVQINSGEGTFHFELLQIYK